MDQDTYFTLINYLLVINSVWVLGFGILCFVWTVIARTPAKKTIFAAFGGALISFVLLRLIVAALPTNLNLLVIIGVLHGLMMAVMFSGFAMVTAIVKKRTQELDDAEKCREEACASTAAQRWQPTEDRLLELGRAGGWL